jgi:hypothetical protein
MKLLGFAFVGLAGLAVTVAPAWGQQCATDADCAAPLTCKSNGQMCSSSGAVLPDGGMYVSDPVCTPNPPTCTWTLQACTADSECTQARWACTQIPGEGASKICFPEGIVCAAGQACPAGWSCVDFATVREADMVDMWSPNGETKYCFPDSLRRVADKTANVDSSGIDPGAQRGGSDTLGSSAVDAGGAVGAAPGTAGSDNGTVPKKSSSGCSVDGSGQAAWPWCLLVGLLSFLRMRRRRE